uniref:Uncharacterized protein n=1 Tax=Anguilla anguilla TaxID=7936 RepID=A0A0E9VYP0_ANGAN
MRSLQTPAGMTVLITSNCSSINSACSLVSSISQVDMVMQEYPSQDTK